MKTTSSIADTAPTVKIRPDWADTTEGNTLPDGTPTLIHQATSKGCHWMVTVEREDPVTEDGNLIHGTPRVLLEFDGDGCTPADLFGYAESLRQAAHLLVELQASH